jgi:F-type H+-transporting ATPase subunit epsilon
VSLHLEIRVPDSVVLSAAVASVQAQDASGRFGVLPHHEAFLTLLVPCVLSFRPGGRGGVPPIDEEDGSERYAAVDGGVLLLEDDAVSIVTREAALAGSLEEVANAASAMLEARRHEERMARTEFAELQTSLLRELHKVEVHPT